MKPDLARLEVLAGRIAKRLGAIDPITIAIIVQALVAAWELIQECRKRERWLSVRKRGRTARGRLRLTARVTKRVGSKDLERAGGERLIDELLLQGDLHSASEIDDYALAC